MQITGSYHSGPPFKFTSDAMFGQHWNTLRPACFPKAMDVLRLWDDGTRLALIAPSKGVFNWSTMDNRMAAAKAAGTPVVYVFGSTPAWAAQHFVNVPDGMSDATSNRPPIAALIIPVIQALATRYKGQIMAYESWNEYNFNRFWCGSKADLLAWQTLLFQTIKAIDPAALVTLPTPCRSVTTVDVEIESMLSLGFQKFSEVATFHGYLNNGLPGNAIGDTIAAMKAVMAKHGCAFPLWDTEVGYSGSANGAALYPDPAVARQWVVDNFMAHINGGVKLIAWYMWDNLTHSPGVTDLNGNVLTPAGQAMIDMHAALRS